MLTPDDVWQAAIKGETDLVLAEVRGALEASATSSEVAAVEHAALGKKGAIRLALNKLGALSDPQERSRCGRELNELCVRLEQLVGAKKEAIKAQERTGQFERERIDPTMPGRPQRIGFEHVLQQTANKVKAVFAGLGFLYEEWPELEDVKYNFDALNYPEDHPAMDDQDTFYVDDRRLLRTQTTAFQGRILERRKPPLRAFTIGRCYRNEAVDRTHSHTFHQVDAFMVDEGVSMAHLRGTLGQFARAMFGESVQVRFRPDFFPFVEPGVDYAISCPFCSGEGCPVCKQSGWIELGGAGLVHPNILEAYDIDTERFSGFAFGLGIERIPMMAHGVDDLRHFLENDLRFLEQFR